MATSRTRVACKQLRVTARQQLAPLIGLALLVPNIVIACPFAEMVGARSSMLNPHRDGRRLLNVPSLPVPDLLGVAAPNNQFLNMGGNLGPKYESYDTLDLVYLYRMGMIPGMEDGPGVGKDLCIWSFQSLPPPPSETYEYPEADLERVDELSLLAHERFQARVGAATDQSFVYGQVTVGTRALAPMCAANVSTAVYCGADGLPKPELVDTDISWPQAITMFKVTADGVDDLRGHIRDWRTTEDGHLPNIRWVVAESNVPGWGSSGALLAKVIVCEDIDPMFLYPASFERESLKDGKPWHQLAWEEWNSHCGVGPLKTGECTYTGGDAPAEKPDYTLSADCLEQPEYVADSSACSQSTGTWGDVTGGTEALLTVVSTASDTLRQCAQTMCDKWGGGTITEDDELGGSFSCDVTNPPTDCTNGREYMEYLREKELCQYEAWQVATVSKRDLAQANSGVSLVAADALAACERVTACDLRALDRASSEDGLLEYCTSFFANLDRTEFPWVDACGTADLCVEWSKKEALVNTTPAGQGGASGANPSVSLLVIAGATLMAHVLRLS